MALLPRRLPLSLALAALALLGTAGCGQQGAPESASGSSAATNGPSEATDEGTDAAIDEPTDGPGEATDEPTETPASSGSPSADESATTASNAPRPRGLRGALLSAGRLPGPDTGSTWRATGTRPETNDPFGVCQKTPLTTIGATEAVVRTYRSSGTGVDAAQVVAEFADAKSAWRSYEVLKSWRGQCIEFMDFADEQISPLTNVAVRAGVGNRFLVSYRGTAGADTEIVAFGLTRVGQYVSLVKYHVTGRDWSYPVGEEPESAAVRRANGLIAQLR